MSDGNNNTSYDGNINGQNSSSNTNDTQPPFESNEGFNNNQSDQNGPDNNQNKVESEEDLKKQARKQKRIERKNRHNQRVARCRFLKNLVIWFLGVLFIPTVIFITLFAVPVNTVFKMTNQDSSKYVSDKVAGQAIIPLLANIPTYSVEDVKFLTDLIVSAIEGSPVGEIVTVDKEKVNKIKFSEIGSETFGNTLVNSVSVDATLLSVTGLLGVDLGALLDIASLNNYEEVVFNQRPDIDYSVYYYQVSSETYARAFDDAGKYVPAVTKNTALYLKTADTYNLVEGNDKPFEKTDINYHNYYYLSGEKYERAFDDEGNYVDGVTVSTELFFPALTKINVMEIPNVALDCVMRVKALDLIKALTGEVDTESVVYKLLNGKKIVDLPNLQLDDIVVNDLITLNDSTINTLCDAVALNPGETKPTRTTLTIGHLSRIDVNNVALSTILPKDGNEDVWEILDSAITPGDPSVGITVGDLTSFNISNILLSSVLPKNSTNEKLWNILDQSVTYDTVKGLTVGDLSTFNINNVSLASVLPRDSANEKLWNVLDQCITPTDPVKGLTISELASFNVNGILLTTVLPRDSANAKLWEILDQSLTPADPVKGLTVADLSSFNINNVRLSCILPESDNPIVNALRQKEDVTLQNIGSAIESLLLVDLFGGECFIKVTSSNPAPAGARLFVYEQANARYVIYDPSLHSGQDTYYLNNDHNVWLILCYTLSAQDADGRSTVYTKNTETLGRLQSQDSEVLKGKLENTTMADLVEIGFVSLEPGKELPDSMKTLTLAEFIDKAIDAYAALESLGYPLP